VAVALNTVVPWGRSLDEYTRMFDLTAADLTSRILDCAAGPSSFNAEMHRRGQRVVSCDPIYRFSATDISRRIEETRENMLEATRQGRDNFVWDEYQSPQRLADIRLATMQQFLGDFPAGLAEGRYRIAELPDLPFAGGEFDLALCSHFLFTYSALLSLDFHVAAVREMCRVAQEVRIFPLIEQFGSERARHLADVERKLASLGYRCEVRHVPYEFQKNGNGMLRVLGHESD
jgi:hypothetical protein